MKVYHAWNRDCSAGAGVVKVVTKPQHGKLVSGTVASKISRNRLGGRNQCLGKPILGFEVKYTSRAGFRGTDSFTIDVIYGSRAPITDSYIVSVY
jgi:hypothetical protein